MDAYPFDSAATILLMWQLLLYFSKFTLCCTTFTKESTIEPDLTIILIVKQ